MKENFPLSVMELLNEAVVTHDDTLAIRAPKRLRGEQGLLSECWYRYVPKAVENGEFVITGYWNTETNESHGVAWGELDENKKRMEEETGWTPKYLRKKEIDTNVYLLSADNYIEIVISNLSERFGARYGLALDYALSCVCEGIIKYQPRTEVITDRNLKEAVRQRLKRNFHIARYENDIYISKAIGDIMRDEFTQNKPDITKYENTIYLQGFSDYKEKTKTIKFYNVEKKYDPANSGAYKLEITYHKEWFKKRQININNLLTQPEIQTEILYSDSLQTLINVLQYTPVSVNMIAKALKTKQDLRAVGQAILSRQRTLTERVKDLEIRLSKVEQEIEQLKKSK